MLRTTHADLRLPRDPLEAGFAYGRACADLLSARPLENYLQEFRVIHRTTPEHMRACADRWAGTLPQSYQEQIDAMALGAGVAPTDARTWLYADIAAPAASEPDSARFSSLVNQQGPMCSGAVVRESHSHALWVARNCDWYPQTLQRGTCSVIHRVPNRIPCVAVGIMGDLDADTGMNAERLWLHMHTLRAMDEPRAGVSCISWLFWMREALETCATLDELERFIAQTDRDRGVLLIAVDGKSNDAAVFECARSTYRRVGIEEGESGPRLIVTNHRRDQCPPADAARTSRPPGGTISRYCRLRHLLDHAYPEQLPDDLTEILGDDQVEMRDGGLSQHLRTIYSAVADPAHNRVWFASGSLPAASTGQWRTIVPHW